MRERNALPCLRQGRAFCLSALALERQPKAVAQQPPAMRVGLKLKQRDILSVIMVIVQATKTKNRKDVPYGK